MDPYHYRRMISFGLFMRVGLSNGNLILRLNLLNFFQQRSIFPRGIMPQLKPICSREALLCLWLLCFEKKTSASRSVAVQHFLGGASSAMMLI